MAAKVLLVEDDNNLREIYQARLSAEGYDIVAAQDGEEALVSAKKEHPDLIISDVMMPRISGFEMLDILRNTEELKSTKVIMLTALGQAEDQTRADNLGADKYLVKSQVTLEDIVKCAQELLAETGAIETPEAPAATSVPEPTAVAAPEPAATATTPQVINQSAPAAAPAPATDTIPAPVAQPVEPIETVAAPVTTTPAAIPEPVVPVASSPAPTPVSDATVPAEPQVPEPTAVAAPEPVAISTPQPVIDTSPITVPDLTTKTPPATEPAEGSASTVAPKAVVPAPVEQAAATPIEEPVATTPVAEAPAPTSEPAPVAVEPTEAVATPEPAVAAPTEPAPAPVVDAILESGPQTLEEEEAAIAKQIDSYAAMPAEPIQTVPPQTTEEAANEASDDAVMAGAVEQLEASVVPNKPAEPVVIPVPAAETPVEVVPVAPVPAEPAVATPPPAPTEPEKTTSAPTASASENVSVAGKKVIKPLNDNLSSPSLNDLLAKEAAKQTPLPPTPIVNGQPADQKPFDPNAISL